MGANWIHGTHGNPIFKLAKAHGLLDQNKREGWPKFERYDWIDMTHDGKLISPSLFREVSKWYAKLVSKCDDIYESLEDQTSADGDRSVESIIREKFQEE